MVNKIHNGQWLFAIAILLSLYACTPPVATHTYYVSTSGNDANDCLSTDQACLTVGAAIDKATPSSQIVIGAGTFSVNVQINKFLTISGAGQDQTTLAAASADAPVIVVGADVHFMITDVTISGGSGTGALPNGIEVRGFNIATHLTVKSVIITNTNIGVLSTSGSSVELVDGALLQNITGVAIRGGTLTADTTTFESNSKDAIENVAVTILNNVTVDHNGMGVSRGDAAISNMTYGSTGGESGRMQITNSTISDNGQTGIDNQAGPVSIDTSMIANNAGDGIGNAYNLSIDHSVIMGNWSGIGNAGPDAHLQVTQSAVIRNTPTTGDSIGWGMGVDNHSGATASIINSTLSENGDYGISNYGGNVTLSYDTVVGNLVGLRSIAASSADAHPGPATTALGNTIIALNHTNCNSDTPTALTIDPASLACDDTLANPALGVDALVNDAGTWVNPLESTSLAIHHARGTCLSEDQRGYARPASACDVGAYQFGAGMHLTAGTPAAETPSLAVLQIATATPSATVPVLQIVTDTPTAQLAAVVIPTLNAFCRKGPGTLYDQVMVLQKGTAYNVIGRDSLNSWWQIQTQGSNACWVGDANVSKQGPVEQAAIVQGAPLPGTPGNFVSSFVCNLKSKTLGVSFNWAGEAGVTGYRIYQNGSLLTTVVGNLTTYHEAAPLGVDLVYELEAFNAYGVAPRSSTKVPACK